MKKILKIQNIGLKLLSVFLAVLLWIYVHLAQGDSILFLTPFPK